MTRRLAIVVAAAALAAPGPAADAGVDVDVRVVDAAGAHVPDLAAADFEVIAGGGARPIVDAAPAARALTLVLLIDATASVPMPLDSFHRDLERHLLPQLESADRVRVGTLAGRLRLGPAFVPGGPGLDAALRAMLRVPDADRLGPSPIWDAVDGALEALEAEPGRRTVLLATDGRTTGNRRSLDDVAMRAIAARTSIHIVQLGEASIVPQGGGTAARVRPDALLAWLAGTTGGSFRVDRLRDRAPGKSLAAAVGELRDGYRLTFDPGARDGRLHTLEVWSRRPGLTVRAPRAFLAPAR